jgi:hypothetical protein
VLHCILGSTLREESRETMANHHKKFKGLCAYCEVDTELTEDHVVPQCLFVGKKAPSDIPIVYAVSPHAVMKRPWMHSAAAPLTHRTPGCPRRGRLSIHALPLLNSFFKPNKRHFFLAS